MSYRIAFPLSTLAAAVLLASCSSGGDEAGMATLSIGLSDAPVDGAAAVFVNVQGIHLRSPSGEDIIYQYCDDLTAETTDESESGSDADQSENGADPEATDVTGDIEVVEIAINSDLDENEAEAEAENEDVMQSEYEAGCETPVSRQINLLELTGGESVQLLDGISIEPGKYPWVRLIIDEIKPGSIDILGGIHDLSIPSGAQTGLKLNNGFTATVGGENQFMIDFDLRKSVHLSGNGYKLRPTLRMVKLEDTEEQRLTGTWAIEDMNRDCPSPMAYVYAGTEGMVADDIGGANTNPVTTAKFIADEDGVSFSYQVDYIALGDYTVAYTCEGELDAADTDDELQFVSSTTVTIGSADTTQTDEESTE